MNFSQFTFSSVLCKHILNTAYQTQHSVYVRACVYDCERAPWQLHFSSWSYTTGSRERSVISGGIVVVRSQTHYAALCIYPYTDGIEHGHCCVKVCERWTRWNLQETQRAQKLSLKLTLIIIFFFTKSVIVKKRKCNGNNTAFIGINAFLLVRRMPSNFTFSLLKPLGISIDGNCFNLIDLLQR